MKDILRIYILMTVACLFFSPVLQAQTTGGWKFNWSDEFDRNGSPITPYWKYTNWSSTVRDARFANNHAWCENGNLVIEATRDADGRYTSSAISGDGVKDWLYGRFEMRGQIDLQPGSWPAWWTTGGSWPSNGEIDMIEYYQSKLLFNVMDGKQRWTSPTIPVSKVGGARWGEYFHMWTFEWTYDYIKLYLDDSLVNNYKVSNADGTRSDGGNPFRNPQHLILNLAIGGQGALWDPKNSKFPMRFTVDYIRRYEWVNETAYKVTVNGGIGDGPYVPGTPVSIVANMPNDGMEFSKWEIVSGDPIIQDYRNANTRITSMPSSNVTAVFVKAGSVDVVSSPLNIEAGKTFRANADGNFMHINVSDAGTYSISVFSPNGRKEFTVIENQYLTSGEHRINWQGGPLANGIYIAQLRGTTGAGHKKQVSVNMLVSRTKPVP
jgi:beta-glucanase (GH16 family)